MSLINSSVIQRCNLCEKSKKGDDPFELYFTSCGHLICDECRNTELCPICDSQTNYVKVDDNLPENLKLFFEDPCAKIRTYSKVIEFQNLQTSIVMNKLQQQKKDLQQQVAQLQKDVKDKTKELNHFKARCSELELELDRKNEQLHGLVRINDNASSKKKPVKEETRFQLKQDVKKNTFFDPSQIEVKKVNDSKKKSEPESAKTAAPLLPRPPTNPNVRNYIQNRNNNSKKITYDSLSYYLQ